MGKNRRRRRVCLNIKKRKKNKKWKRDHIIFETKLNFLKFSSSSYKSIYYACVKPPLEIYLNNRQKNLNQFSIFLSLFFSRRLYSISREILFPMNYVILRVYSKHKNYVHYIRFL